MSAERDAILKARQQLIDAEKAWREAENAAYRTRMTYERAHRQMEDLKRQFGERRFREISAGGQ